MCLCVCGRGDANGSARDPEIFSMWCVWVISLEGGASGGLASGCVWVSSCERVRRVVVSAKGKSVCRVNSDPARGARETLLRGCSWVSSCRRCVCANSIEIGRGGACG